MTVTNGQEAAQPASVQTRKEGHAYLAAQFTHITPAEMRAAEQAVTGSSPVADLMESRETGRQAAADGPEAGT